MQQRYSIERLAAAFDDLLELSEVARQEWFAKSDLHADDRQQLMRMLRADADAEPGFLDESALAHAHALTSEQDRDIEPSGLVGQQFGPFRLTRLLGQGGMATVFLAERIGADFEQTVAVKLLRRGLFSAIEQKLFRRERRLLAQLNHPNIAHLIDGGVTEAGIPYLVMEYVDGLRLDQHVIEHRLDLRARLELFITACRAVEAAHQALIVHRDIKPSNILVTRDGVPKLLDFGIAKLLPEDSGGDSPYRTLTAALTPGYAAPEQMTGSPVTTATDVYALGVVLHELLTGQRPKDIDTVIASNAIDLAVTARPGALPMPATALKRTLRGDLDNIVARALSAEPERRYPTAAALIDDLERYQEGRPVRAHPRSRWYVVRKFVRRHRTAVAITMALSIAVFGSLGIALWQANAARVEAHRANVVRDFLLELLDTAKANLPPDQQPTPGVLASKAAERLEANLELPELTRAELLFTLAEVAYSAAEYDRASAWLDQVIAIRSLLLGESHPQTQEALMQLAVIHRDQGHYAEARELHERVLSTLSDRDSEALIDVLTACGLLEMAAGRPEKSFECIRDAGGVSSRLLGPESEKAISTRLTLGDMLGAADRVQEAIEVLEPALADWRRSGLPRERMDYVTSLNNLGVAQFAQGQAARSVEIFSEVLRARRKTLPEDHPDIANSLASLGMALSAELRFDEADANLQQALRIARAAFGESHVKVLAHLGQLATNEQRRGRNGAALDYASTAGKLCMASELSDTAYCAHSALTLAIALRESDADESLANIDLALAAYRRLYASPHVRIAAALDHRARTLLALGRLDEAFESIEEAASMRGPQPVRQQIDLTLRHTRAMVLHRLQRHTEALVEIDSLIPIWRVQFSGQKDRLLLMLETKARIQKALGSNDAAAASLNQALALGVDPDIFPQQTKVLLKQAQLAR